MLPGGDAHPPPPAAGRFSRLRGQCPGAGVCCGPIWYAIFALVLDSFGGALAFGTIIELRKDQFGAGLYWISNGSAILQSLLSAPALVVVGYLSQPHRLGRKGVLLIMSGLSVVLKMLYLFTLNQYVIVSASVLLALAGLNNGGSGSFVVMLAWITDWCRPEDKVTHLGMLFGALFGAVAASQYLAILLPMSTSQVFQLSVALSLVSPLYLLLFFPSEVPRCEARTPGTLAGGAPATQQFLDRRPPPEEAPEPKDPLQPPAASPREAASAWKNMCVSLEYLFKTHGLVTLIYLAINFTDSAVQESVGLYMAKERGFGPGDISALLGMIGLAGFFMQCFLVPAANAWGVTPHAMLVASVLAMIAHFLCYALLTSKYLIIAMEPLGSLGLIAVISTTAIISGIREGSDVPVDQGVLMGSLQGLKMVATCVGPLTLAGFTSCWKLFPAPFNIAGIGFVFLACLMAVAFLLAVRLYCKSRAACRPAAAA